MIRKLLDPDGECIYDFCVRQPALNLYFLGNLESLGVSSDICEFWGSFAGSGQLNGVLMRYMDGWNIADGSGCDYASLADIMDAHTAGAASLQDNPRYVENFVSYLRRYDLESQSTEFLCELYESDFRSTSKPWPVRQAGLEDYETLCRFYANAESMSRTARGVERPLRSGRVFVVEVDGEIVSSVLTNAETRTMAMIGGVYTPPAQRGNGYGRTAMVALCSSLITANLRPVLYYENVYAGRIYRSMGFKDLGTWRSVSLKIRIPSTDEEEESAPTE